LGAAAFGGTFLCPYDFSLDLCRLLCFAVELSGASFYDRLSRNLFPDPSTWAAGKETAYEDGRFRDTGMLTEKVFYETGEMCRFIIEDGGGAIAAVCIFCMIRYGKLREPVGWFSGENVKRIYVNA